MGVDTSNDQMGIYCWGTNENKAFVEPITHTDRLTLYCCPALEMPFFKLWFFFFFLNKAIVNNRGCNWKKINVGVSAANLEGKSQRNSVRGTKRDKEKQRPRPKARPSRALGARFAISGSVFVSLRSRGGHRVGAKRSRACRVAGSRLGVSAKRRNTTRGEPCPASAGRHNSPAGS